MFQQMNRAFTSLLEICWEFLNWKVVFCILSPVSKMSLELIDLERDEDFSMH